MVTLKDIAASLNISTSTVSRVVNQQDRVSPATRRRVLAALEELNYQPNDNARRLKTNQSNVIGVIVPDIANPYYASVIKGIEEKALVAGWSVLLCHTDEKANREVQAVNLLRRQKVAAILVASSLQPGDLPGLYQDLECPVVFYDNVPPQLRSIFAVTIDNFQAAVDLTNEMIRAGHQRIFMITGPAGESSADDRLAGWQQAMQEAGLERGADWSSHGDFKEESGRLIMESFLKRKIKPTAVLVANNLMTYGAVKAIEQQGLKIPADISLGAFDIVDTTGLMRLKISTVVGPAEAIGMAAADLILSGSHKKETGLYQKIILPHTFYKNSTIRQIKQKESV